MAVQALSQRQDSWGLTRTGLIGRQREFEISGKVIESVIV